MTALVARADGDRLQKTLLIGARLVSREGDLWRWDGFTSRAEAPKPAALRLAQRARLQELEATIARLAPGVDDAAKTHAEAIVRVRAADGALGLARQAPPAAERAVGTAREAVERHAREAARRDARLQALDETLARFAAELAEAQTALAPAEVEAAEAEAVLAAAEAAAPHGAIPEVSPELAGARAAAGAAREAENRARFALEGERRERDQRLRRRDATPQGTGRVEPADQGRRGAPARPGRPPPGGGGPPCRRS